MDYGNLNYVLAHIWPMRSVSVEQMQTDLDSYLEHYNTQRPRQGWMMEEQTPYSMFKRG